MKVMAFNKCNVLVNLQMYSFFVYILSIIYYYLEIHSNCMKEVLLLILRVVLVSNISFYILTVKFVDNYSSFVVVFLPIA